MKKRKPAPPPPKSLLSIAVAREVVRIGGYITRCCEDKRTLLRKGSFCLEKWKN